MNVAGLNVGIGGDPAGLINALNASTRAVTQFSGNVQRMNATVNTSTFSIGRLLATVGAGISVRQVLDYADGWTLAEGKIRLAAGASADLSSITRQLFQIAQDTRSSFEATADLYARVARNSKQLGLAQSDVIRVTRAVGQAMRISSAGVQESRSAMIQLGQALASGRLQGDELRSVLENAPRLAQAIAQSIGVTVGQLRALASEGKLTAAGVAQAILQQAEQLEKEAAQLPTTIGQSFTRLGNSVQRFVGETDRALGGTRALVGLINGLGRQFDENRAAVEAFAFALGASGLVRAAFAARAALIQLAAVQTATAWLALLPAIRSVRDVLYLASIAARGFWTALTGPVGIAIAAIGIATALFFKWRKGIADTKAETDKLRTALEQLTPAQLSAEVSKTLDQLFTLEQKAADLRGGIRALTGQRLPPSQAQLDSLQQYESQIRSTTTTLGVLSGVLKKAREDQAPPIVTPADDDALKKFVQSAQRVIETFKIMQAQGEHVHRVVERLRTIFDDTQRKLRGLKDPFSEEAVKLRSILRELGDLPEIKLRLRIDTSTREIRQMTENEVNKLTAELTRSDSTLIPKVTVQPIIDTSLATSSMRQFTQRLPVDMANAIGKIRFDVLRDRLASQLGSIPLAFEPVGLDRFQRAVDVATAAQNRLNLARLGGDRQQVIAAELQYATALDTVRESLGVLARNLDGANIKADDQAKAIAAINEAASTLGITLGTTVSRLDKFLNFARAATGIGRGVLGIADAMKTVSEETRRAIGNAVNLFDALTDLAQAQKDLRAGTGSAITVAASGLGAAGAGLSLINSVVGAIQADNEKLRQVIREQTDIMRENNRTLDRLRAGVEGFTGSIGDLRLALGALRSPLDPNRGGTIGSGFTSVQQLIQRLGEIQRKADGVISQNILRGVLSEFGSSLAEVEAIADDLGITLFDQAGRIIPDAFLRLQDAIELQIKSLTHWQQTLDDTRTRMELEADVFDFPETAQQSIKQGLDLLSTLAPDLFAKFFAGVNPNDAAQVELALRLLTRTFLDNVESIENDFGKLFGKEDLIEIIRTVEQGLDGLAGAANTVTDSLLNVPSGFKVARARFDATLAETITNVTKRFDDLDLNKDRKGKGKNLEFSGDSFSVETVGRGAGGDTFIIEVVNIDARDKPIPELVDNIKLHLKDKARSHGLTRKPSDMLNT